jgi:hypothetical protein
MPFIASINRIDDANISSVNGPTPNLDLSRSASTAPSVSTSGGGFGFVTATITKSGGGTYTNPNYSVECTLADGTVTVTDANIGRFLESDKSHLSGILEIRDTNASTAQRTISVKAQEFGDSTQSTTATGTYDVTFCQKEYVRLQACDVDGTATASNIAFSEVRFYTGSGQTGTVYPTTNLTANDSETDIVVSMGGTFGSGTYDPWKGADGTLGTFGWALSQSAANNWWQIQFEDGTYDTKPIIKSIRLKLYATYHGTHIKITGSDNADHSSATTFGIFPTVGSYVANDIG